MNQFQSMNLPDVLLQALNRLNFTTPTPIQSEIIPSAIQGRDLLGSAQTGTGKTLAFSLPILTQLLQDESAMAVVLTPTRELAQQVAHTITQLLERKSPLTPVLLIGGESMPIQLAKLRRNPRIIVGTPGRVIDHLERKTLDVRSCKILVLDEADRMLDMGFSIQLDKIVAELPQERQTLMFSATLPPKIEKLAQTYQKNPERVAIGSVVLPSQNITQEVITLNDDTEKYDHLVTQLTQREGSVIIFVKTKIGAQKLATRLTKTDFEASAIHGDLRQNKRDRVLKAFRQGRYRIMVATDIAARGLDVPHIQHVINYDLPQCPEDYVHRIGRTARAGATGNAVCFITPQCTRTWRAIQEFMEPEKYKQERGSSRPASFQRRSSSSSFKYDREREYRSHRRPAASSRQDDRPHRWTDRSNVDQDAPKSRPHEFKADRAESSEHRSERPFRKSPSRQFHDGTSNGPRRQPRFQQRDTEADMSEASHSSGERPFRKPFVKRSHRDRFNNDLEQPRSRSHGFSADRSESSRPASDRPFKKPFTRKFFEEGERNSSHTSSSYERNRTKTPFKHRNDQESDRPARPARTTSSAPSEERRFKKQTPYISTSK